MLYVINYINYKSTKTARNRQVFFGDFLNISFDPHFRYGRILGAAGSPHPTFVGLSPISKNKHTYETQ